MEYKARIQALKCNEVNVKEHPEMHLNKVKLCQICTFYLYLYFLLCHFPAVTFYNLFLVLKHNTL